MKISIYILINPTLYLIITNYSIYKPLIDIIQHSSDISLKNDIIELNKNRNVKKLWFHRSQVVKEVKIDPWLDIIT
jgi:hypothetical protein